MIVSVITITTKGCMLYKCVNIFSKFREYIGKMGEKRQYQPLK